MYPNFKIALLGVLSSFASIVAQPNLRIEKLKTAAIGAYKAQSLQNAPLLPEPLNISEVTRDSLYNHSLDLGKRKMPFVFFKKGKKPEGGWPLYIDLHGGGRNEAAAGPHEWEVNTRDWITQITLFRIVYDINGLVFIPRMADDREGRWHLGYVQEAIDNVIEEAVLRYDVNPDKVYLMGISEGGYAAYSLGAMMADRWAGSCSMAAAVPIKGSPPENLRNVAFRCGIGELDTMYGRINLARAYFKRLEELKAADPDGYNFYLDEQKDKGHHITYKYGPEWISKFERTPVPRVVNWKVEALDDRFRKRMYWLSLEDKDPKLPLLFRAEIKPGNHIDISAQYVEEGRPAVPASGAQLTVYLPDKYLNLKKPVFITVNGQLVAKRRFREKQEAMERSYQERKDPKQVFADFETVKVP